MRCVWPLLGIVLLSPAAAGAEQLDPIAEFLKLHPLRLDGARTPAAGDPGAADVPARPAPTSVPKPRSRPMTTKVDPAVYPSASAEQGPPRITLASATSRPPAPAPLPRARPRVPVAVAAAPVAVATPQATKAVAPAPPAAMPVAEAAAPKPGSAPAAATPVPAPVPSDAGHAASADRAAEADPRQSEPPAASPSQPHPAEAAAQPRVIPGVTPVPGADSGPIPLPATAPAASAESVAPVAHTAPAVPASAESVQAPQPAAPPVAAAPNAALGVPPYQMVRTLQSLQDQMAQGSVPALSAQRALLSDLDKEFLAVDPSVWQDSRNARAAVIHVLSGGNPAILRRLLSLDPKPAVDEKLMRGALAYVAGRASEASEIFDGIDARSLPDGLASQVAMVQAALVVGRDPAKAQSLLDMVRLLSPGTLVEEAALRREVLVTAQTGQVDKFESLSRQYLDRFRSSVYAGNFRKRFAAALTRMGFIDSPDGFKRVDVLIDALDPESKRELYLMIAKAAIAEGKTVAVEQAAARALSIPADPADEARARLYKAAALTVSPNGPEAALDELKKIDRSALPPSDSRLYRAASKVAQSIKTAAEPQAPVVDASAPAEAAAPQSAVVTRADKTLKDAEALLASAPL